MMKSSARNIQLESYDDIFKTNAEKSDNSVEKVQEIALSELFPFKNHPFQVRDDEDMEKMVDSIRQYGILNPVIVRPRPEGGYELISGHRRKRASELAGLETIPVIIRNMDDISATIFMVDTNLQREALLPSERAYAFKMKLDAMKRQGKRTDLTSSQVGTKLEGKRADQILAEQTGESRNQIQRYIRLTELIPPLLKMVDEKKLSLNPAVDVSYLTKEEQTFLLDVMQKEETAPSIAQAQRLKKYSQEGKLSADVIDAIMTEEKREPLKVTLTGSTLKKFFPRGYTQSQIESVIFKLLQEWSNSNNG